MINSETLIQNNFKRRVSKETMSMRSLHRSEISKSERVSRFGDKSDPLKHREGPFATTKRVSGVEWPVVWSEVHGHALARAKRNRSENERVPERDERRRRFLESRGGKRETEKEGTLS